MNDIFSLSQRAEAYLYLVAMNVECRPISFFDVSHGTHNAALVGCREIMIRALLCGASNMIIVHFHPSGVPEPSKEDFAITARVEKAADLIGIILCDHNCSSRKGASSTQVLHPDTCIIDTENHGIAKRTGQICITPWHCYPVAKINKPDKIPKSYKTSHHCGVHILKVRFIHAGHQDAAVGDDMLHANRATLW